MGNWKSHHGALFHVVMNPQRLDLASRPKGDKSSQSTDNLPYSNAVTVKPAYVSMASLAVIGNGNGQD